ncbi:MAG: GNAT family protein [Micropepsaceae bacterium]
MTILKTERLLLRRARPDDAEALHPIFADPRVMKYLSELPHPSLDRTREWLDSLLKAGPDSDDFIVERAGRVIGKAGSWKLPEVGYILHPDQWGKGVAREAMTAVIGHLFAAHAMPALTADVDPGNENSIRLLDRLGFVETHRAKDTFLIGGKWFDSVYFALGRDDWARRA